MDKELREKINNYLATRLFVREFECLTKTQQFDCDEIRLDILAIIKEALKEPPVLSDEEIAQAKSEADKLYWTHKAHPRFEKEKYLLRTQRDADVRFYGSL